MSTVIDALIVTLGLDPKDFTKGQKEAATAFTKTREAATKTGKDIEASSQKAADSIDRIARNALRLFAVFTAGKAIKDFVADITSADSALGRLSQRIGQASADISAVATAVQRTGGSFDAAAGSFQRFSDSIQELKATGNTGILPFLYRVQAAGGKQINLNKDILQSQVDIADNLKAINDKSGAATANYYGKQLGFDEGTVALMVQGGKAYRDYIEQSKRLGIATKEDTDAAQAFQRSIRTLMQASEGLGRSIMTAVTPVIVDLLKPLQEWIEKNREWIKTEITARVREFADYLKSIDWKAVGQGIRDFVAGCNTAAQAVGGWSSVIKALFALWLGSKFFAVLRAIGLLRLALTGGRLSGGLMSALGVLGTAGIAGILATSAATDKGVANADKPGVATRSDDENSGAAVGPSEGCADPRLQRDRGRARRWWGRHAPTWLGGDSEPQDGIHRRGQRATRRFEEGGGTAPRGNGRGNTSAARTSDMMRYAMDQLRREGVPENQLRQSAAHLVGQAHMESGLDPNKVHDGGTGYGIYGARDPSPGRGRRTNMLRWLEANGYARNSAEGQMRYMTHEAMSGRYRSTRKILMGQGTGNIDADTNTITGEFESPAVINHRAGAVRGALHVGPSAEPTKPAPPSPVEAAKPAAATPAPPVPADAKPTAWKGIPGAAAAVAQVQAAQMARVSNDNRSTTSNQTKIGDVTIHTAATDANGIARGMEQGLRNRSFAMAANYGQA